MTQQSNQPNSSKRSAVLKTIAATPEWDMLIIGGGITGAGIAREAARRGIKTLLVEQKDFSWGTSSRSSKMVHGGLRYIASGDIKTTMHSVRERERMLTEAPGLVEQMAYVMPHYKGKFPPPMAFGALLRTYDYFARKRYRSYHKGKSFLSQSPNLKDIGLKGVSQFADAVTDDSRLVMRVLYEAVQAGDSDVFDNADDTVNNDIVKNVVAINYLQAKQLLKNAQGGVIGAVLKDTSAKTQCDDERAQYVEVRAKVVVNATGAWADHLCSEARSGAEYKNRIRPARGSHLVISRDRLPASHAYTLLHPVDKRALFVFPWETRTVIGTTDLDHPPLDDSEVGMTAGELDYLLMAANDLFPSANLSAADVISTWAGVRPLISEAQDGKRIDPSKEKRDHSVWLDNGLVTVSGGKLTTFRLIALDVLKQCADELGLDMKKPYDDAVFSQVSQDCKRLSQFSEPMQRRLKGFYGNALTKLFDLAQVGELETIPQTNTLWAELRYAARYEQVVHLDDLLLRRTRLGLLLESGGAKFAARIKVICASELGWDDDIWADEWQRYQNIWQRFYFLPEPTSSSTA